MSRAQIVLAAGFGLLALPLPAHAQPVPSPVLRALAAVDLTPDRLRFDRHDMGMFGGDRWRLQIFDAMIDRPLRIPGDVEIWQRAVVDAADRPSSLFTFASARLGTGVRRGLISDPVEEIRRGLPPDAPLATAIRRLWAQAGRPCTPEEDSLIAQRCAMLPDSFAFQLAVILEAADRSVVARNAALEPLRRAMPGFDAEALARDAVVYVVGTDAGDLDPAFNRGVEEPAGSIDMPLWNAGADDLLLSIEATLPALRRTAASVREPWRIETPLGSIEIGGPDADRHDGEPALILIDPAGNDTYTSGAAGSPERPVSILIDLEGDDTYAAADTLRPAFGAGILGIGVLIDDSGADVYRAGHVALGTGLYGIGILIDGAGDDTYDGLTATQGAGIFGIGILADAGGNDRYHAFQQAQGYGYVKGAGLLVDRTGNDVYVADDSHIRFPSAQSKEHNSSLAQGFGFGKRADFIDGHSLAGGFGLLADGSGDDSYRCGVFGQGAGYWYGVGILSDAGGDDVYDGIWYVQAAAAHFALGVLWDGGGNDRYRATMNMAQGAGHDFSLGLLYERSGNDQYDAPNLSLGGGERERDRLLLGCRRRRHLPGRRGHYPRAGERRLPRRTPGSDRHARSVRRHGRPGRLPWHEGIRRERKALDPNRHRRGPPARHRARGRDRYDLGPRRSAELETAEETMSLLETIDRKLHEAMKAHDQRAADCLRMLKARITERRTSATFKGEVTDAVVREVAAAYVKQLTRAIGEFEKGGAAAKEHIEKLRWEIDYLSEYQPRHLDEGATRVLVEEAIRESGATDPGQVGRVIGLVIKSHKDEVDAALVRRLVEEALTRGA